MARKKKEVALTSTGLPADYPAFLESLKSRVRQAQTKAMLSVNRELIQLYWDIGRLIVERQEREGWGKGIVDHLAGDIQKAFPGIQGFSPRNVWRMRSFFLAYRPAPANLSQAAAEIEAANLPQAAAELSLKKPRRSAPKAARQGGAQPVRELSPQPPQTIAEIPWFHNVILLEKVKDPAQRLWYAGKTLEHGWSRAVLTVQIETDLYSRQGKAVSNFAATLPSPQSDLAQQALKDPYLFDFLTLHDDAIERDLELGLVDHIQKFLLELGAGFAFVGRQVPLSVGEDDDYIDLLFYHLKLRCFIVIDLKMKKFTPEDAGKMNYYLSAVDDLMKHATDAPSMGLILCKTRDRVRAEYALRDINKPIGVAEWQTKLVQSLPEPLKGSLPSIEQLEAEFGPEESP
jgi:predicted nuclease of restriction endonuclease-like (RecB) superfamily